MTRVDEGFALKLHHLLNEDLILLDLQSQDRDGVLHELVQFIQARRTDVSDKGLYEKFLQRERLGSTAVRDGYAIPHCKIRGVEPPLVSLALSKKGIHFDSVDGKPSYVFFAVVSSADIPSLNIQILAVVAQLIRKSRHLLKKISRAQTGREILDIIREEEEKLP
jgi:PTS system nitrogen regulatory IIA component